MALQKSIKKLIKQASTLGANSSVGMKYNANSCYPPGHYYSPIINVDELKVREKEIWDREDQDGIAGINLCSSDQIELLKSLSNYYKEIPFNINKTQGLRYYYENDYYTYTDAIILHAIIRHKKPKQIIEIGSGFSSAVMLDTNELFFQNSIKLTFVEPYTERLYTLMSDSDKQKAEVIEQFVQKVPLEKFQELDAGDILFIDSSHVSKTGSDVNYLLFEVLPHLKPGVLIHFHDIFYPFEYPKDWVMQGRNWNENYFLKAFLMFNDAFKILLFSDYIHKHHPDGFEPMPLTKKNYGGNLWIEKK